MIRTYNIGSECYALITSTSEPEFLLPTKVVILEKYTLNQKTTYKVKIREIFETNLDYLKEHIGSVRVSLNLKSDSKSALIKKNEIDSSNSMSELIQKLNDHPFFLEDNYITQSKDALVELYNKFVKYIINYHFRKLYQLTSRSFLANQPVFENQKDMFKKRVERIGFGDMFEKYNLKLDI